MTEYKLLTAVDLAVGSAWLTEQGVAEAPVFQVLSLQDRVALAGLTSLSLADPSLVKEAAAFAVVEARAPSEFCDYFRLYLALAGRPGPGTPETRQTLARSSLDILLPWMFGALDCPSLPQPVSLAAATEGLATWLQGGRLLGFGNAITGARQLCERTDFTPETADVGPLISRYLSQASAVIATGPINGALNQDGQSAQLQAGGAVVDLSAAGVLSLEDFQSTQEPS